MTEFQSINPATEEIISIHEVMSRLTIEKVLNESVTTFRTWKKTSFRERSGLLEQLGSILRQDAESMAKKISQEMGKVYHESLAEIEKCAKVCEYYAAEGPSFLESKEITTEAKTSYISHQPLGVILGIMPWNFPFWQVFRFAVPTLMAGNVCLLKHAPNVLGCAEVIENSFRSAGFPEGSFRSLIIDVDRTGDLIEDQRVAAVTITGSTRAGKSVAAKAGAVLKKSVMELGGSDPYIILEDADMELAVETCVKSRLLNAGQSCIAAKRFIVLENVYDDFIDRFYTTLNEKRIGDPMTDVDLGPMAREDLRLNLHDQVERSIRKGAHPLLGCKIQAGKGFYYPVSILAEVMPGLPAFDEELFGPVAAVIKAKTEGKAIELANHTVYGLGAAVFTSDLERGRQIAELELNAGCCFVNQLVHSDPRLPFGGINESGFGRELGPLGILEFVNAKTVYVR